MLLNLEVHGFSYSEVVVSNSTYAERQIDGSLSFPIKGSDQFIGNDTRFKDGFRGPQVPFNVTLSA